MNQNVKILFVTLSFFMLVSCTTYHISTESLLSQFANTGTEKKEAPFFFYKTVNGNDLREIQCLDNKGREKK
jgi:hypothetical protein